MRLACGSTVSEDGSSALGLHLLRWCSPMFGLSSMAGPSPVALAGGRRPRTAAGEIDPFLWNACRAVMAASSSS